ncbi:hypothetical protein GF377_09695 [candidate division GN15 bacterium]|nr:hypothetical protein [candidate division GN15 bacterium]
MHIQLFLTPVPMMKTGLQGKTVVVVDVLRSSTSIAAILAAGARSVIPTGEPGAAGEMYTKIGADAAVLAGEREGVKIENFQYGNSPTEFTPETVGGKNVIICTTNGTAPFERADRGALVLSGALVNISKLAEAVAAAGNDVVIVCSGQEGGFSIEDTLCGGMLIDLLASRHGVKLELNDAASLARLLYADNRDKLEEAIVQGEHGRFLASIGLGDDVVLAAQTDTLPHVGALRDGRLVPVEETVTR